MKSNLSPQVLLDFIEGDFSSTWDALAGVQNFKANRGNFMFARQAMVYLEVACRLCQSDPTGSALKDLSDHLLNRDSNYFIRLPGLCFGGSAEFQLPSVGADSSGQMIAALFDLIRNGQAHQYQQIPVLLSDGIEFRLGLTGAQHGLFLGDVFKSGRPTDHLKWVRSSEGDISLKVRTDVLFLDVRDSIRDSALSTRGLSLAYLARPRPGSQYYQFSGRQLEQTIASLIDKMCNREDR